MPWNLKNTKDQLSVALWPEDDGGLHGTVTLSGNVFAVSGGWSAAGSLPARMYSAFSISGRTSSAPDVPFWISGSGIMTGSGTNPSSIDIQLDVSSSADGTFSHVATTLLPA